jgi:hypothetical protein
MKAITVFLILALYAMGVVAQSTTTTTNTTNTTNVVNVVKVYSAKNLNPKIVTFINKKSKAVQLGKHPTLVNTDIPVTDIVPGGSVSFKVGTVDSALVNTKSGLKYSKKICFSLTLGNGTPVPFELANMDRTIYIVDDEYSGQELGGIIAKKNKPITYCVLPDAASNTLEEIVENTAFYSITNSSSYSIMFMDADFANFGLTLATGKTAQESVDKIGETGIFSLKIAIIDKAGNPTQIQEIDLPIASGSKEIEITDAYFDLKTEKTKFVSCCLKNESPYIITISVGAYIRKNRPQAVVINPGKTSTFATPYGENTLIVNFTDDQGVRQKGYCQFGNNGRGLKTLYLNEDIEAKFLIE